MHIGVAVADGGSAAGTSSLPSISGDGSRVAFASTAPLVAGDTGTTPDAYVRDLAAGTTRRASAGASSGRPALSVNGARVAYADASDVLVHDLSSGAVFRASRLPDGSPTPGPATRAAITGVGSVASFTTQPAGATSAPRPLRLRGLTAERTENGKAGGPANCTTNCTQLHVTTARHKTAIKLHAPNKQAENASTDETD